jgi:hypothetical protein
MEPAYWLGNTAENASYPILLNQDYQTIFEVLETDPEVAPLLGPFPNSHEEQGNGTEWKV